MTKSFSTIICTIILSLLYSCGHQNDEYLAIKKYVHEKTGKKIINGKILLVNNKGCVNCTINGCDYIFDNGMSGSINNIIVSDKVNNRLSEVLPKENYILDSEDQLEKLKLPGSGFILVDFKNGEVDTVMSLNPSIDLKTIDRFLNR